MKIKSVFKSDGEDNCVFLISHCVVSVDGCLPKSCQEKGMKLFNLGPRTDFLEWPFLVDFFGGFFSTGSLTITLR